MTQSTAGSERSNSISIVVVLTVVGLALLIAVLIGLLIPANQKGAEFGSIMTSRSNLKQMNLAVHNIAASFDGKLPPSVGTFSEDNVVKGPIFYHLLNYLDAANVYVRYQDKPLETATESIRTYAAPLDPTNPGNTTKISYASNAAFFGLADGGSANINSAFGVKGATNTVFFMERFAVTGAGSHTWNSVTSVGKGGTTADPGANNLFGFASRNPKLGFPGGVTVSLPDPIFGQAPTAITSLANGSKVYTAGATDLDSTAHGFNSTSALVGIGDGSVRTINVSVTNANVVEKGKTSPAFTIWTWACVNDGVPAAYPAPVGW